MRRTVASMVPLAFGGPDFDIAEGRANEGNLNLPLEFGERSLRSLALAEAAFAALTPLEREATAEAAEENLIGARPTMDSGSTSSSGLSGSSAACIATPTSARSSSGISRKSITNSERAVCLWLRIVLR